MAKFSLLTVLTLNAAGFNDGINKAKASTASLAKGTEQAANTIKGQFGKLAGMTTPLVSSMGALPSVVMGGVGAFKTMIPAINGVKTALIASGIGAIVVGLGLAFAALTSYLSGTSEGSKKLREMFGYVTGTITVLMNRVKYLGSSIFSILTGDIEGFKKSIKDAFASGFLDEVVDSAKKSNDIEKQKSANVKIQRDLKTQISALEKESAKMNQKLRDPKLTEGVRLEYLNKLLDVEDKIEQTKLNAASAELKYRKDIVALKGLSASGDEKNAVADAQVALDQIETDRINAGTRTQKIEAKLMNAIKADEKEAYKDRLKDAKEFEVERIANIELVRNSFTDKGKIKDYKPVVNKDDFQTDKLLAFADATTKAGLKLQKFKTDSIGMLSDMNNNVSTGLNKLGTSIAGSFADIITSEEGSGFKKLFAGILSTVGEFITQMGAAIMSYGVAMDAFKNAITNPYLAIAAGMGLMIAGGVVSNLASKGFANGGIVGGNSFSGDKVTARVNSGEMILNSKQQANLFAMANGSSSGGGEVLLRVKGSDLVGVLSNQNKRMNNMR